MNRKKIVLFNCIVFCLIFLFFFFNGFDYDYETFFEYIKSGIVCYFLFPIAMDNHSLKSILINFCMLIPVVLFLFLSIKKIKIMPYSLLFIFFSFVYIDCGWLLYYPLGEEKNYTIDEETAESALIDTSGDSDFTLHEFQSIQKAKEITNALEDFYRDHGYYPKKLKQLKPKYLTHIPKTRVFSLFSFPIIRYAEFDYKLDNCNGYREETNQYYPVILLHDEEIQNYYLHFRYNFDEDYYFFASGEKWKYHYH